MNLQQNQRPISKNKDDDLIDNLDIDDKQQKEENPLDDGPDDDFGDYYSDMSSPTSMQKYNDLLKELTDFNPIVKDTINGWLGLTWNEETRKYEQNNLLEPIMNMKGAMWCATNLKTYLRKTNFLTNISEEEYKWLYWDINRVVWIDFVTRDDFGVKNNQDYHRIGIELVHSAILLLTGAGGGKYTQFLGSSTMRNEHVNIGQSPQTMALVPQKKRVGLLGMAKRMLIGGN